MPRFEAGGSVIDVEQEDEVDGSDGEIHEVGEAGVVVAFKFAGVVGVMEVSEGYDASFQPFLRNTFRHCLHDENKKGWS